MNESDKRSFPHSPGRRAFTLGALAGGALLAAPAGWIAARGQAGGTSTPYDVDDLLDSLGVNTHMWDANQSDGRRYDLLADRLLSLGVRNVRDSAGTNYEAYAGRLHELGREGVRFDLIVDPRDPARGVENGIAFARTVRGVLESLEGPNEYDQSGVEGWRDKLIAFQRSLFAESRAAFGQDVKVLAPSFVDTAPYRKLPAIGEAADCSNLHAYFSWHEPGTSGFGAEWLTGYGSIPWSMRKAKAQVPDGPVWVSESGYPTDVGRGSPWAVPESVAGRYIPRLWLGFYRAGARRIFLHELLDRPDMPEEDWPVKFGLLHDDQAMSPKPAYRALGAIIAVLTANTASAIPFDASTLAVEKAPPGCAWMTVRGRSGTVYGLAWLEQPSWDGRSGQAAPAATGELRLRSDGLPQHALLHVLDDTGAMTTRPVEPTGDTLTLPVTDRVSILELRT
ncbi:hypothetical protein [Pararhizobium mangrovi]|uniref:Glycosyl hydrolase n=1 Tax=Pararhizobium mangrovi TaxID=2590452 RepID=A0A506U0Q3_9HYPH|nr:hypothetical protein [Pararhizobium mangrovi]TPW27922.1 hypothetical protein FJU11_10280 [Pararhizobium mangrovi]